MTNEETVSTSSTAIGSSVRGRAGSVALWVVQVILALQFLGAGMMKLAGAEAMVAMFGRLGGEPWLRYGVGIVELAGAVGILVPLLSGLAAACLSVHMLLATLTTVAFLSGEPTWLPLVVFLACALVAGGRWPETQALVARVRRSS
jgi:uncharacterized membrane protein YphA (DoxX/SURF4 family)